MDKNDLLLLGQTVVVSYPAPLSSKVSSPVIDLPGLACTDLGERGPLVLGQ